MCCCLDFVCQRNNSHKLSLNNWVWQKLMICKIWPLWIIQRLQKLFIIRYNSHLYTCCIKATFLCYTVIDVLYTANIFVASIKPIVTLFICRKKNHFKFVSQKWNTAVNKICKNIINPFFSVQKITIWILHSTKWKATINQYGQIF